MYYIGELTTFEKRQIKVKQYIRKGKIVRASQRKIDKKKLAIKATVGIASALGISAGTYLLLKNKYRNNLNVFAKKLKANPNIGKTLNKEVKDITFCIGGFAGGVKKAPPLVQSRGLKGGLLKLVLPKGELKKHEIVTMDHNFTLDLSGNGTLDNMNRVKLMFGKLVSGENRSSLDLAEEIYSWHVKNPNKPINILGFSAGGSLSRDVKYILERKGVNTKNINLGNVDFGITPSDKSINLMGKGDNVKYFKAPNAIMIKDVDDHDPGAYFKSKEVTDIIRSNFYQ